MRRGVRWLLNAFGRDKAPDVAGAYRRVLAGNEPDRVMILQDLARYCNVGNSSFTPSDGTGLAMAFNEGQRDVFNHIAEMLDLRPDHFPQLLKDQHHDD